MQSATHYATLLRMTKKNPAAVQLGRKGGKATAKKLTPKERTEAARKAAKARWAKTKSG
jgi:hypothetical protein